jgi:excisionase family DNA binding protein
MERLLTPKEAADLLAVTSKTVKEWLRRGELTGVRVRKLWRIRENDLREFIKAGDCGGPEPTKKRRTL